MDTQSYALDNIDIAWCPGCGNFGILKAMEGVLAEMQIPSENLVMVSGIGQAAKIPHYMKCNAFNGLHGRALPAAVAIKASNPDLVVIAESGDGDMYGEGGNHFLATIRRNPDITNIVHNNMVYGLTKGQFSATAEKGLELKHHGINPFLPIDIAKEALIGNASFVARSFAGDPKQVLALLKAALSHRGTAVLDIISPCVSFNNREDTLHSYHWGRQHEAPLHDISYVPTRKSIILDEFKEGETKEVTLHDGSVVVLKKLEKEYDPRDKWQAMKILEEAEQNHWLVTGLIYVDPDQLTLYDHLDLTEEPLNRMSTEDLRPAPETLEEINRNML